MSDHLAVLKTRLMIDIIIWSSENMYMEQGKKQENEQEKEQEQEQEQELEQELILTTTGSKFMAILLKGWIFAIEFHQKGSVSAACAAGLFW